MNEVEHAKRLFFEALALMDASNFPSAEEKFRDALRYSPASVSVLTNLAIVLRRQDNYSEAQEFAGKAIVANPGSIEALLVLADCYAAQDNLPAALDCYRKCISLDRNVPEAHNGSGSVLAKLKRFDDALAAFDNAVALDPKFSEAYVNRGNTLHELKRHDAAFADFDKALVLAPDFAYAWLGRGKVFRELKRYDEALAAYDKALALNPGLAEAWLGRGNVFEDLKQRAEALAAYDRALALKPDLPEVEGVRLHGKMQLCDWSNFKAESEHLIASIRNGQPNTQPFTFLAVSPSPDDQLRCARLCIAHKYPPSGTPLWRGERYDHGRIRVGYLSADFCDHAVASLIAGVFEGHDKARFEVTAFSIGLDDRSDMRRRLQASFEHFVDAENDSDDRLAQSIRDCEIDILVDLMGFTENSRTGVLARRPAPLQLNYLGYLGTMGASYIDYIVADRIVIPGNRREAYSEKVIALPNCCLPADRARRISEKQFTRAAVGLPGQGFVFCCFNSNYKITPDVFAIWMRMLTQVDGSVLWLVGADPAAMQNLTGEAIAAGVAAERLIFAPRVPLADHQARVRLAGLFLDTFPYNAGATATDTLLAGVPLLTCVGETFVGRMGASALDAIGLPELIAATPDAYEHTAIDLATHPEKIATIKAKLANNRLTTPLFDTKLYTRHIEAAYTAIYERHRAGLPPEHIDVPDAP